jgi:DNA-binding transcriptional MerR regulator
LSGAAERAGAAAVMIVPPFYDALSLAGARTTAGVGRSDLPGAPATLTIREVVARTGVPAATLRVWETRHGFRAPARLASGHRRYTPADCEAIERVVAERAHGLSLRASIARVASRPVDADPSLFATLRRAQPALSPQVLPKRALTALSRAIEDEICARAERPLLFGAFQRERFYRASERPRRRDLLSVGRPGSAARSHS